MNPQSGRAVAGLQGDGTKGGTKNGGALAAEPDAVDCVDTGVLIAQLGLLLRRLSDAGSLALPLNVRRDLAMLLANAAVEAKTDR